MLSFFESPIGCIKVSGSDSIDFFNRMSTNDLSSLPDGSFRKTVFTNDKGRIIDIVTLLNGSGNITMLTSPGYDDKVIEHLDKYIIMDDVTLEKQDDYVSFVIFGENLPGSINSALNTDINNDESFTNANGLLIFFDDFIFDKVIIAGSKESISDLKHKLSKLEELRQNDYEIFRIYKGLPSAPNEINEQINPVECDFNRYISFTKGCYIGQEVIARLDSQGKVPKQMVKITSDNKISPGDKIFAGEKDTGFITSAVKNENIYIGLGFIRSVNLDYDAGYIAKSEKGDSNIKISKVIE
jgi:tRNA-modifying protein YgfZ